MNDSRHDNHKVVQLRPRASAERASRRNPLLRMAARAAGVGKCTARALGSVLVFALLVAWQAVRLVVCAVLVLTEPLVRLVLMGLAFLSFLVTLIFGFLMNAPHFAKWGMLTFSIGLVLLYWLFLFIMSLFMRLPPYHDPYR